MSAKERFKKCYGELRARYNDALWRGRSRNYVVARESEKIKNAYGYRMAKACVNALHFNNIRDVIPQSPELRTELLGNKLEWGKYRRQ